MKTPPAISETQQHNLALYTDYYAKPDWWFSLRYDTQVKLKTVRHLLHQAAIPLAAPRVLDIGFGSGHVLFSFKPNCAIYGIEISASALEKARRRATAQRYREYGFVPAQADTLPYPDAFFDLVIASHVLEHVEDDRAMLAEILRVLRPGGAAVLLIPINENYADPKHLRRYTAASFSEAILQAGFGQLGPTLENELLFHLVEKVYHEEALKAKKAFKALVALAFNPPAALMPFGLYRWLDRFFLAKGFQPRQFGCVAFKTGPK